MRPRVAPGRLQRGVAAVELALILAFGLALAPSVVVLGRVFWTYTALQKATHDAARYLATVSVTDMTTDDKAVVAVGVARQMVLQAAAAAHIRPALSSNSVTVLCDGANCGTVPTAPVLIRVQVSATMFDELNGGDDSLFGGDTFIVAEAVVHYAN
jgi:Flp pilus assembly protein TadG